MTQYKYSVNQNDQTNVLAFPVQGRCEGVKFETRFSASGLAIEVGGGFTEIVWTALNEYDWWSIQNFFGWRRSFTGTWYLPDSDRMWHPYNGVGTFDNPQFVGYFRDIKLNLSKLEKLDQ